MIITIGNHRETHELDVLPLGNQFVMDYKSAHEFVDIMQELGFAASWDGYDIVIFDESVFKRSVRLGYDKIRMRDDGTWLLPKLGKYGLRLRRFEDRA